MVIDRVDSRLESSLLTNSDSLTVCSIIPRRRRGQERTIDYSENIDEYLSASAHKKEMVRIEYKQLTQSATNSAFAAYVAKPRETR